MRPPRALLLAALLIISAPALAGEDLPSETPDQRLTTRVEKSLTEKIPEMDETVRHRLSEVIVSESSEASLDVDTVLAVIQVESSFNVKAGSDKGCKGLMQIKPSTFRWWVKARGYEKPNPKIMDPEDNVRVGIRYLGELLSTFQNLEMALMAYNGGPGNLEKWNSLGRIPSQVTRYSSMVLQARDDFMKDGERHVGSEGSGWFRLSGVVHPLGVQSPHRRTRD